MIYFTSDQHFYHQNVIKYANRPFHDYNDMNESLIKKWNERIGVRDEVYILGDITMKGPDLAKEVLSRLKGKKHLILGNHDGFARHQDFDTTLFESIQDYKEIKFRNTRLILFHYPIEEWNGFYKGSISLHGHQHNHEIYNYENLRKGIRRYDVGVDANYMAPVSGEDIVGFFE